MLNQNNKSTRRDFIINTAKVAGGSILTASALAKSGKSRQARIEQDIHDLNNYDFILARAKFAAESSAPCRWNTLPIGDKHLLEDLSRVVRCKVKEVPRVSKGLVNAREEYFNAVVSFEDFERVRRFPFVFMTNEGDFRFTQKEKDNFKAYIEQGGFVLMDDCVLHDVGDHFYRGCYALLIECFGPGSVQHVPNDHEIFHNVYNLGDFGLPFVQGVKHGPKALFINNRLAVFLSSGDIHCGWVDRDHGWYGADGRGPGCAGYQKCIEMGINIIMYAMTH